MKELDLVLYDDARAASWQPFTLTRPAGELLLGVFTARARAERIFGVTCIGHIADNLDGFEEEGAPRVSLSFAGSADLATQLSQGAPADVFASADALPLLRAGVRVSDSYRQALQRSPRDIEAKTLMALYDKHLAEYQQDAKAAADLMTLRREGVDSI